MEGKSVFTELDVFQLRKLIAERARTSDQSKKKTIRAKMRAIGFYISDWGIKDFQPEDFEDLIRTGRIRVIPSAASRTVAAVPKPESRKQMAAKPSGKDDTNICNIDFNTIKESLPPLVGSNPTILILGTLPGDESLQKKQYYAKSGNRFWSIIACVVNCPCPSTYEEKKQLLFTHKITLWDIAHTADRQGSLDSDIRSECPNDLQKFLRQYPTIRTIAFNGGKAERLYNKYFAGQFPDIRHLKLRSSSPANRQFNDEEMIKDWKQLFE